MQGPAEIAHGPMLIGFTINVLLLGIMTTQLYIYYTQYKDDKTWIKLFVATLYILNIANTVLSLVYLYQSLIVFFGNVEKLTIVPWVFGVGDPILTGLITSAVQMFFAWRIFVLTKNLVYFAVIVVIALLSGVSAFVTPFIVAKNPFFVDMRLAAVPDTLWLGAGVVADILITTILVYYLRMHKTGLKQSDMMIDRIIRFTVQTGLLTVIVAVIDIIFFLAKTDGIHVMLTFTLCKLYSTSLMSSLNSRRGWGKNSTGLINGRDLGDQILATSSYVGHVSHRQHGTFKPQETMQFSSPPSFEVRVEVESHQLMDIANNVGSTLTGSGEKKTLGLQTETMHDLQ
ncbi:hypothetical protein B0H34DRAFT_708672 [Crassisporium funariophilum]|nr:hypothetical protein B0H34DRAFT_708672 [Crassisporium funariophilum]